VRRSIAMQLSLCALALLVEGGAAIASLATTSPRLAVRVQPSLRMSGASPDERVEMYAAQDGRRVAVSGLQPKSQSNQEYVSVPPPEAPMPPSLVQRAKGPFMGVTLLASAAIAAFQSNRMYKARNNELLADFGATMIFHLDDAQEMTTAIKQFRQQLGPGSFRAPMFQAFVVALATDVPVGVEAIQALKQAAQMMKLSDSAAGACLEAAATELESQPSVMGKLTFVAERALPMAASMAKLRSRFPNWSLDTVTALQRAMLENLYRDTYCAEGGETADGATLELLGLSTADAARLMQEVQEKEAAAAAEAAEKAAEAKRAQQLEEALRAASEMKQMRTIVTSGGGGADSSDYYDEDDNDEPALTGASGTHEYECTKCGYILFPAAGREDKFFGVDFKCPQCDCGKEEFVDNGPV